VNKKSLSIISFGLSTALVAVFIIKCVIDYVQYATTLNSAPFYVWIVVNAIYFIIPAIILAVLGIVINKKKICGILTEMSIKQGKIDYIIVGIGINVTNRFFPEEISRMASSILIETGLNLDKELLINQVWEQFQKYYNHFMKTKDLSIFQEEYESLLVNRNQEVKVLSPAGEYTGVAKGITNIGELIVDTKEGIQLVSSGEVSVRGIYGYV